VNRRRAALLFSAAQPPAAGAKLTADGTEAGHVTSAAFSPLAGKPIGMGYLRREHGQPGSRLECNGAPAEVIELPLPAARSTTP
jgi:glycine cleavage system aminomethyltransferase T